MSKYIYGIDFGTSNSAISILDTETNEIIKTFNDASLIYFPQQISSRSPLEYFVGKIAVEKYVESEMQGRFMKSLKKILPKSSFTETRLYGKKITAEDLVCLILKYLKSQADTYINENVTKAIFGRPVVFDLKEEKDKLAQERLLRAAQMAGFDDVNFQMEPIAAAFTYERNIKKEELVLVADLGGGTSDFTLMKLGPDKIKNPDRKNDIIGQGGIYIGGDNFDSSIMWNKGTFHFGRGLTYRDFSNIVDVPKSFYLNICSWEKMNFFDSIRMQSNLKKFLHLTGNHPRFQNLVTLIKDNLGYAIFQSIEKTKIDLSDNEQIIFEFSKNGIEIKEPISIEEFSKEIIIEDLTKIQDYLLGFLEKSKVKADEIDTVFMTGGTSMVRPIKDFMIDLFGKEAIKSGDNFNSVVNGLSYSHVLF